VDYVAQMTKWLQRQEAVDRQSAYLDWVSATPMSTSSARCDTPDSRLFTPSGIVPGHAYRLRKRCPFPKTPVSRLVSAFGAQDFVHAFQAFLNKHMPNTRISASIHDRFDVYKSVVVLLPSSPHVSEKKRLNKLRACCSIPSRSVRKPDTPAHFDTALIVQNHTLYREMGGLHG
jgi:hypothetical protein